MADYPYTLNTGSLRRFFEHIQSAGVPPRANRQYLETSGFKSKNDRSIVNIVKSLGFVDSTNVPTDVWKRYRNRQVAPTLLGSAIRGAYGDLFTMYPDAYRKDDEALLNFFSAQTSVGKAALDAILGTFKTLCGMAKFDEEPPKAPDVEKEPSVAEKPKAAVGRPSTEGLTINVNIQLQLPATADPTIYENLFAALKRHLIAPEA